MLATGGHVETLPDDRKRHGKDAKKAYWANRPGELPSPPWVFTDRGEGAVEKILEEAGDDPTFWIATDPDREGEFIAWCLNRLLASHGPTRRVTFQEVTEEAVKAALEHPRDVDARMVDSALVRKFIDRLVGFRTSKTANAIVPGRGASMGRVQTPTLGFVVERELEREAHEPIPYFEVHARAEEVGFKVRFHDRDDADAWRNETGRVDTARTFNREAAEGAHGALAEAGALTLDSVTTRTRQRKPDAPFSTDALLQTAGSRFSWSPRKTSALASMLYEAGHITYIRTDSTRLAASAVKRAREVVGDAFGEDHLGPEARANVATGPTQDAHEAIRPTRLDVEEVDVDDADAERLYRLVRAQTLASQMAPSERTIVSLEAAAEGLDLPLTGSVSWRTFDGWEAAYAEFMGDVDTSPPEVPLEEGARWSLDPSEEERENPLLIEDETKPPPRYRPHTLIKAMKEAGIGRPSTYSRTVDKLEERDYVRIDEGQLVPTERGRTVWLEAAPLYARDGDEEHDAEELFDTEYTALMEERLDRIATGELAAPEAWEEWRDRIRDLHEAARERKKSGRSTMKQQKLLGRLLANPAAEAVVGDVEAMEPLSELSWQEAQELAGRLREAGVQPVPTSKQLDYLEQLAADLELGADELDELIGVREIADIRTSPQASDAIETLKEIHDERRPPSEKQRRFIEDLMKQADVDDAEAAELAGVASLDDLSGGAEGSASALIDALQQRLETAKG